MRKLLSTPAIVFKGSGWAKKERASSAARGTSTKGEEKHGATEQERSGEQHSADGADKSSAKQAGDKAAASD